jgi:hypothetical protein
MAMPVVTVASGGLPVVDVTAGSARGLPVSEAAAGRGTAVTRVASGGMAVVYDSAAASQWLVRATSLTDPAHIAADMTMINGLVADGDWPSFDMIQFYATQNGAAAPLNMVSASYPATVVGSPPFVADRGYTGVTASATVRLDTPINLSTSPGLKFTQNSAHVSAWVLTDGLEATGPIGSNVSPQATSIFPRQGSNTCIFRVNSNWGSVAASVASPSSIGYWLGNRLNGTTLEGWKDAGLLISAADTSGAPINAGVLSLGHFTAPSTYNGYGQQVALITVGGGLSPAAIARIRNRFRTRLTAVGVP